METSSSGTGSSGSGLGSVEVPEGFRVILNRQFMASGNTKYILPCDVEEINRLDYQHYMVRFLLRSNFNSPVEEGLKSGITVLDAGCGSGRWLLDMAQDFPKSTFIGVEVADVFPTSDVPPNLTFLKANTLEGLPFPDEHFDFVFQRFMFLAFSPSDWTKSIKELARITKPGGWLELIEGTLNFKVAPPGYERIHNALSVTTLSRGIDAEYALKVGQLLEEEGITQIVADYVSCPIGWKGIPGELLLKNVGYLFDALKPTILPIMDMGDEEYAELTEKLLNNFGRFNSYANAPYAYGMKPLNKILDARPEADLGSSEN